jgi:hypothetical protein
MSKIQISINTIWGMIPDNPTSAKKSLLWCRRMKKHKARDNEYFNQILWSDECKLSAKKQESSSVPKNRG